MTTLASRPEMEHRARRIMESHWRAPGFTVPNPDVYPAQFLWDSCFHAVIWTALDRPDRALIELQNLFVHQATDGFVPHMTYWHDSEVHADFWGRPLTSSITQPPMYGHALAELRRRGVEPDEILIEHAEAGLRFLVEHRLRDGLVLAVHPWETGCDDSPRWDSWCPGGWSPARWKEVKGELVASLAFDRASGSPIGNPRFEVGAAGFNALVAFNILELATVADRPLAPSLRDFVDELRWRAELSAVGTTTIVDDSDRPSSRIATTEGPLAVLVDPRDEVLDQLLDPDAFGGAFGPTTVHRKEASYDPGRYWRGPAWPQLTYLFWVAARRAGRADVAYALATRLRRGAGASGFAEYWDPDTGAGLGARPQSWACLATVVSEG